MQLKEETPSLGWSSQDLLLFLSLPFTVLGSLNLFLALVITTGDQVHRLLTFYLSTFYQSWTCTNILHQIWHRHNHLKNGKGWKKKTTTTSTTHTGLMFTNIKTISSWLMINLMVNKLIRKELLPWLLLYLQITDFWNSANYAKWKEKSNPSFKN